MTDFTLKIEYKKIEELSPYQNNARNHGEEDIEAIAESIKAFGFNDPIGIWHGEIVEGHGRLEAAKLLGLKEVPCLNLEHLTDEERRAYALAHNKTAELSAWDYEIRSEELEGIESIDMSLFGFKDESFSPADYSDLFVDAEEKAKEPKTVQCPHCGAWVTV